MVLADSMSGERPPASFRLFCPHMVEGTRKLPIKWGTGGKEFKRALIPFLRDPPSRPQYLPKALPPTAIALSIRISTNEFVGETHSDHSSIPNNYNLGEQMSICKATGNDNF